MRWRTIVAAVALAGCAAGAGMHGRTIDADRQLVSSARTAADMRKLLGSPVEYGGLWFRDADCQRRFIAPGTIGPDRIDAFARCLVTLHLRIGSRTSPLPDVAVFTDDAGFEIEAQLVVRDHPEIAWIGFAGRHGLRDALPSIAPEELARLRAGGTLEVALGPDAEAELARVRRRTHLAYSGAWVKLCIDANGAVTGVHLRAVTSPTAARVFADAARGWKLRPFELDGRALPVCSLVELIDPAAETRADGPDEMPMPMPADLHGIYVSAVVLHRVSGDIDIAPPQRDMVEISRRYRLATLVAVIALCTDEHGKVTTVRILHPSGVPGWDARLASVARTWRYAPLPPDGTPQPLCTVITLIYSQR
jgi:TonB family protein